MSIFEIDVKPLRKTNIFGDSQFVKHTYGDTFEDSFWYKKYNFKSGNIYGLIGEYGEGNWYLSCLLGGLLKIEDHVIEINGLIADQKELKETAWYVDYNKELNKSVQRHIEEGRKHSKRDTTFKEIKEMFKLSDSCVNRKLKQLSWERWRASLAIGYAYKKKIFHYPYLTSSYYDSMLSPIMDDCFEILKKDDALILLPAGSDRVIKNHVDYCIQVDYYLDSEEYKKRWFEKASRINIHQRVYVVTEMFINMGIKKGDIGYIIEDHGNGHYNVEFSDENDTIKRFGLTVEHIEPME